MDRRTKWTVAIFLFVFGDGLVTQTRGSLLPTFEKSFSVSESLLELVAPAGTVGLVVTVLVVGTFSRNLDVRRYLVVAVAVGANYVGLSILPVVVGALSGEFGISTGIRVLLPAMAGVALVVLFTRLRVGSPERRSVGEL